MHINLLKDLFSVKVSFSTRLHEGNIKHTEDDPAQLPVALLNAETSGEASCKLYHLAASVPDASPTLITGMAWQGSSNG